MALAEAIVLNKRDDDIRCFKDNTVMGRVEGHPGWIYCPLCGLVTQLVDYDADDCHDTFGKVDPEIAHLWDDEQSYKSSIAKKRGGGGPTGRKSKPERRALPDPAADLRAIVKHNARVSGAMKFTLQGWLGINDVDDPAVWSTLQEALAEAADYSPERIVKRLEPFRGKRVRITVELLESDDS